MNEFVEQLALDLPKFMEASGKEKAQTLLQIIGVGNQLTALEQQEKELLSLERALERLYVQLEDVPEVSGKVSKSSDDFPYIEQHVTVQMQEPKKASEIKDRIRKKEKRHKALLADMAEAERIIMKMPEGLSRQILEQVYLEGMSQQEVGEVVGYTQSMVSKIIKTAMKDS